MDRTPLQMRQDLQAWSDFVLIQSHHLTSDPDIVWQQAVNMPKDDPVARRAMELRSLGRWPKRPWFQWIGRGTVGDSETMVTIRSDAFLPKALLVCESGRFIVVRGFDNRIRIFRSDSGEEIPAPPELQGTISWIGAFPSTGELAWSSDSGSIYRGSPLGAGSVRLIGRTDRPIEHGVCTSGGRLLVLQKGEADPALLEERSGRWHAVSLLAKCTRGFTAAASSPRLAIELTGEPGDRNRGAIAIIDEATTEIVALLPEDPFGLHGFLPIPFVLTPDGRRLFAGVAGGRFAAWDIASRERIFVLDGHAVHLDGDPVGLEEARRRWEARGSSFQVSPTEKTRLTTLASDPLGRFIASAGSEGEIKLWDVSDGELIKEIAAHGSGVLALCFFPDGSRLASAGQSGEIKVWRVPGMKLQK